MPSDIEKCPVCGKFYGFVNCRVTLRDPKTRNICLSCAAQEELQDAHNRTTMPVDAR